MISLTTWNVNSIRSREPHVLNFLQEKSNYILCLQELKCQAEQFPAGLGEFLAHPPLVFGQKTYNGVAVLSDIPGVRLVRTGFPGDPKPEQSRVITVKAGDLNIVNVYVPNGESTTSDKYEYKLAWLDAFVEYIQDSFSPEDQLVICGDFNIAPGAKDVWSVEKWEGRILYSEPEKERLNRLLDWGLIDVYRELNTFDKSFSWWDYRGGSFQRNTGLRIDLHLITESVAEVCGEVEIVKSEREKEKPSDHAPVTAYLEL